MVAKYEIVTKIQMSDSFLIVDSEIKNNLKKKSTIRSFAEKLQIRLNWTKIMYG